MPFCLYSVRDCFGKCVYIGSTTQPESRLKDHKDMRGAKMLSQWQKAIKYDAHIVIIAYCQTHEEMQELEIALIDKLKPAFNITRTPNPPRRIRAFNPETRQIDNMWPKGWKFLADKARKKK